MKQRFNKKNKKRRGIYVLPNMFTTVSLFFGFLSIISSLNNEFEKAAISILISCIFDILDGRIARLTNTTSQFGLEYDSLSDLVSFGVAPVIFLFKWTLQSFGRLGWLACFMYLACGALRLARFNVYAKSERDVSYFKGLPIPAAASFISAMFLFGEAIKKSWNPAFILISVYVLSFLMVSNIRYVSLKGDEFKYKRPFDILVTIVLVFVLVAYKPRLFIPIFIAAYVLSGPVFTLYNLAVTKRIAVIERDPYEDNRRC